MSDISKILFVLAGMLSAWQIVICAIALGEVRDALDRRRRGLPYCSRVTFTAAPLFLALVAGMIGVLAR